MNFGCLAMHRTTAVDRRIMTVVDGKGDLPPMSTPRRTSTLAVAWPSGFSWQSSDSLNEDRLAVPCANAAGFGEMAVLAAKISAGRAL